jgi:SAM-dependent methyltransferase
LGIAKHKHACLFPGRGWKVSASTPVSEFLDVITPGGADSIEDLLRSQSTGLSTTQHWVDMGSGRALAMRQLALFPEFQENISMSSIDLIDYGLKGLSDDELVYLEDVSPGITNFASGNAPKQILANIESVQLTHPATLITSVESLQYLNNPLEAICNWYNQLEDNGILVVSSEHDWASWIRREGEVIEPDIRLMANFLEKIGAEGIQYAQAYDLNIEGRKVHEDKNKIRDLVIQHKSGTELRLALPLTDVWINPYDYKAAYYSFSEVSAPVEVVHTEAIKGIGRQAITRESQLI